MDVTIDFSFGRELDTLHNGNAEFLEAFDRIRHTQSLIERAGPFNFLISRRQFRNDLRIIERIIEPSIQEALALPQETLEKLDTRDSTSTFVQQCATISRDRQFLRDEMMGIIIAGRDTTAMTLAWCFYELARHPAVVADLRRLIEKTVGLDREPTLEELKNMKLLSNILNETLRLYPVTPFNVRASLRDTTLPRGGGPDGNSPIGLLAGTTVYYSTHLLRKAPLTFPTPHAPYSKEDS
jgi:cytochrome P450